MNTSALKIVGGIVVVLAIIGAYVYPKSSVTTVVQGVSSTAVTNNDAKIATITMAPATAGATSTTILNTDSTDREITSGVVACTSVATSKTYLTGTGLASFIVNMSTSTSASGNAGSNTNYAQQLTIATSSPWAFTSSTTDPAVLANRIWPTGTYLALTFNATNTAACTVGVHYLSL